MIFDFVEKNAEGRNRTIDTRIFSPLLDQLSYLGDGSGNWRKDSRSQELRGQRHGDLAGRDDAWVRARQSRSSSAPAARQPPVASKMKGRTTSTSPPSGSSKGQLRTCLTMQPATRALPIVEDRIREVVMRPSRLMRQAISMRPRRLG